MQGVNKSPFLLSPSTQKNMKELQTPKNGEPTTTKILQSSNNGEPTISHDQTISFKDFDSACSTPYVSAPSSPGRSPSIAAGCGGFFYSAPTSPMHFLLSASSLTPTSSSIPREDLEEFDFSASWYSTTRPMSSADELFLNGKIRPQKLAPLLGVEESRSEEEECSDDNGGKIVRGRREMKSRNRSLRRIRSMSPLRTTSESFPKNEEKFEDLTAREDDAPPSGSSSRSSSVGRNSKRWVSLKEFLYRSKSEGRNNGRHKYFWSSLSFSPVVKEKDKKTAARPPTAAAISSEKGKAPESGDGENVVKREQRSKTTTAARKRRVGLSAHELHYTANRAQAEEMRRKTFLPYRQGLLGCLGFNSKSYGAMNGFARALNPVSSS